MAFRRRIGTKLLWTCVLLTLTLVIAVVKDSNGQTVMFDQPRYYSLGNCDPSASDPPNMIGTMANSMSTTGWTVVGIYQGSTAWPQDWIDPGRLAGGLDYQYADNVNVAVFSGHANTFLLGFSHSHNGACEVNTRLHMSLGPGTTGGVARTVILYGCCAVQPAITDYLWNNSSQTVQIFGFAGVTTPDEAMANTFYNDTAGIINVSAWIMDMKYPQGNYDYPNQPAIITSDNNTYTGANLWCRLKAKNCVSSGLASPPYTNYIYYVSTEEEATTGCDSL